MMHICFKPFVNRNVLNNKIENMSFEQIVFCIIKYWNIETLVIHPEWVEMGNLDLEKLMSQI